MSESIVIQSENINEIAAALSNAQKTMDSPKKNKSVEIHTKTGRIINFDYADLEAIKEVTQGPLGSNNLSISHAVIPTGEKIFLKSKVMHSSGQWIASLFPLSGQIDMKEFAGEMTYAKRYNKTALLDLFADDDKDGDDLPTKKDKDASKNSSQAKQKPVSAPNKNSVSESLPKKPAVPGVISAAQRGRLYTIANEVGWKKDEVKAFLKSAYKYESSTDILKKDYDKIVNYLQNPETVPKPAA